MICYSIEPLTTENGLFHWSTNVIQKISDANLPGSNDIKDKELVLIGNYYELGYELMLSANQDVSQNPGFESLLVIFSNSADSHE
jgi:hypothetical protein